MFTLEGRFNRPPGGRSGCFENGNGWMDNRMGVIQGGFEHGVIFRACYDEFAGVDQNKGHARTVCELFLWLFGIGKGNRTVHDHAKWD